jgi:VanZ family protein
MSMKMRQSLDEFEQAYVTQRFVLLVLAMIATAVIVTVIMFRTLYVVMG